MIFERMDKELILEKLNGVPIVLVGMMGCGKSSVAQLLGDALGLEVCDTDEMIVQEKNKSINAIFEEEGEVNFRIIENIMVESMIELGSRVISVGGGAVTTVDTLGFIKRNSVSIWLDTELDILAKRLEEDDTRPLLKGDDLKKTLAKIMSERRQLYACADIHIKNDGTPEEALQKIGAALEEFLRTRKNKNHGLLEHAVVGLYQYIQKCFKFWFRK